MFFELLFGLIVVGLIFAAGVYHKEIRAAYQDWQAKRAAAKKP